MGGTKYATTTATQQLPDYLKSAYEGVVGRAQNTANLGYTPYSGGFTSNQQQAFNTLGGLASGSNPMISGASTAISNALTPAYQSVDNYMSPYLSDVLQRSIANMQETNAQGQQQVIGNAAAKGALGGNRVAVAQSELARQQGLANNQTIADILNQGYNTALGAAQQQQQTGLAGAQGLAGLNAQQIAAAQAQLGAGTQEQQFNYAQYLNQQAFPYAQTGWLAGTLGGLAPTAGGTTTQQTPQGNTWSQLLGAGLGIASLFNRGGAVNDNHYAPGGVVPYGSSPAYPGYMDVGGPYANDNSSWGGYIPQMQVGGGGGSSFPAIQTFDTPSGNLVPESTMRAGASNIKDWLSPKAPATDTINFGKLINRGGVVPKGFAGGGTPTLDDIYGGILLPGTGGLVGGAEIPPPVKKPVPAMGSTIDTVNALDADRLGLNVDTTPDVLPQPTREDPYYVPPVGVPEGWTDQFGGAGLSGGQAQPTGTGLIPPGITTGQQFLTTPAPGYSQNAQEAVKSLFAGKGLNVAPDVRQALLAAGLGMMASKSPFALQGIGEGGLEGIKNWQDRQALERANAQARNEISTGQGTLGLTGRNIDQAALDLYGRLAKLGPEIGFTQAQTGLAQMQTATGRYDWNATPNGFMVVDKTNPTNVQLVPYTYNGQPEGAGASAAAPLRVDKNGDIQIEGSVPDNIPTDPRLWTQYGQQIAAAETQAATAAARNAYIASQDAKVQLEQMKDSFARLPADGLQAPGTWAQNRADFAKEANTLSAVFGLPQIFDPNAVAASEELHKLTTNFGFNLSRQTGSDVASSVVNQAVAAVPSIENSPQGFKAVTSAIQAGLDRQAAYYQLQQQWQGRSGGSIYGFDQWFNAKYPPSLFARQAIVGSVPSPAVEYLREHPDLAADFDKKYGDGMAAYILGK